MAQRPTALLLFHSPVYFPAPPCGLQPVPSSLLLSFGIWKSWSQHSWVGCCNCWPSSDFCVLVSVLHSWGLSALWFIFSLFLWKLCLSLFRKTLKLTLSGHHLEAFLMSWRSLSTDTHIARWGHYSGIFLGCLPLSKLKQHNWCRVNRQLTNQVKASLGSQLSEKVKVGGGGLNRVHPWRNTTQ